jgi:hypothetical protein
VIRVVAQIEVAVGVSDHVTLSYRYGALRAAGARDRSYRL